ncbi:MAG TPA: class I SAM-dependent methyltransferase [Nannocystaceae bacterium]|nr:class I SAM-dependent methyltransferase [Nannocystaceae bacterium]
MTNLPTRPPVVDESRPRPDAEIVSTREGYDRWSEIYDDEHNPLCDIETPPVERLLGDVRDLAVCDLGCGTGRHTAWLANAGARVTALDFSPGMISRARAKAGWEHVHFVQHDLTEPLPLPGAAFDRVLSSLVVDHIPDLVAFFGECRRIVKPDGLVVVSVMHPAMMLRGVLAHFTDPGTGRDVFPQSALHQVSDYVMAALAVGLRLEHASEHLVDAALAQRSPRAAKFAGWPLLLLLAARPDPAYAGHLV